LEKSKALIVPGRAQTELDVMFLAGLKPEQREYAFWLAMPTKVREERGLPKTQEQMAEYLGVHINTIVNWRYSDWAPRALALMTDVIFGDGKPDAAWMITEKATKEGLPWACQLFAEISKWRTKDVNVHVDMGEEFRSFRDAALRAENFWCAGCGKLLGQGVTTEAAWCSACKVCVVSP